MKIKREIGESVVFEDPSLAHPLLVKVIKSCRPQFQEEKTLVLERANKKFRIPDDEEDLSTVQVNLEVLREIAIWAQGGD